LKTDNEEVRGFKSHPFARSDDDCLSQSGRIGEIMLAKDLRDLLRSVIAGRYPAEAFPAELAARIEAHAADLLEADERLHRELYAPTPFDARTAVRSALRRAADLALRELASRIPPAGHHERARRTTIRRPCAATGWIP
jgi:hypothetical protein